MPVGQSATTDALLFDRRAGSATLLRPLPILQLLPELGRQPFLAERQAVACVSRALQPLPLDELPVKLGAEFLPQRLVIPARLGPTVIAVATIVVAVGTCNGFTEILDAFATAACSARICVIYN